MPTPIEVARFMLHRLNDEGELYQEDIVEEIEERFGGEFVHENENENLAIRKDVLREFERLTPNIVWDRAERCWRRRETEDGTGRQAAED